MYALYNVTSYIKPVAVMNKATLAVSLRSLAHSLLEVFGKPSVLKQ